MSPVVIVDNEFITLNYLPDDGIIHHTIHQPIGGQPLRDALNAGTDALAKYGATKWLSDDRKNGPLSPEDTRWGFESWNRRTVDAGLKFWAIVVPEDLAAAGTLMPVIDELFEMGVTMMVFTNLADALEWLKA